MNVRLAKTTVQILAVVTISILVLASSIHAQTSGFTNGDFETGNYSPWEESAPSGVNLTMNDTTVHGGNYALTVENTLTCGAVACTRGARQGKSSGAISVTGSEYYTLVAWIYIPDGSNNEVGFAGIQFYTDTTYGSTTGSRRDTAEVSTVGSWAKVTKTTLAPSNAGAAMIYLYVKKPAGTSAAASAYFDDVEFYHSNANAVALSSFTAAMASSNLSVFGLVSILTGAIALTLAGLLWARRRRLV